MDNRLDPQVCIWISETTATVSVAAQCKQALRGLLSLLSLLWGVCLKHPVKTGPNRWLLQPTQVTTFQFFQVMKLRKFAGPGTFLQKENKISPIPLKKKEIPTSIQTKHTLTCMRRNEKSLQEIAKSFQVLNFHRLWLSSGEKVSFSNVPDLGLCSYKHWFREVLCCYLFSTNDWTGTALKKGYIKSPVSAGLFLFPARILPALGWCWIATNLHFGLAGVKPAPTSLLSMHSEAACTSFLPSHTYWNPHGFVRHYLAVCFWEAWLPMFIYKHRVLSSFECLYHFVGHRTCPCTLSDTRAILHWRACSPS